MLWIILSFGAIDALVPLLIILILIAAAAGITRGYSIFKMFGISTLAGISGLGLAGKGSLAGKTAFSKAAVKAKGVGRTFTTAGGKTKNLPGVFTAGASARARMDKNKAIKAEVNNEINELNWKNQPGGTYSMSSGTTITTSGGVYSSTSSGAGSNVSGGTNSSASIGTNSSTSSGTSASSTATLTGGAVGVVLGGGASGRRPPPEVQQYKRPPGRLRRMGGRIRMATERGRMGMAKRTVKKYATRENAAKVAKTAAHVAAPIPYAAGKKIIESRESFSKRMSPESEQKIEAMQASPIEVEKDATDQLKALLQKNTTLEDFRKAYLDKYYEGKKPAGFIDKIKFESEIANLWGMKELANKRAAHLETQVDRLNELRAHYRGRRIGKDEIKRFTQEYKKIRKDTFGGKDIFGGEAVLKPFDKPEVRVRESMLNERVRDYHEKRLQKILDDRNAMWG